MSNSDFQEVAVRSDWCWCDHLAGEDLKDGETLEIKWKDGEITTETVIVEESTTPVGDHGHDYDCTVRKAYVRIEYHGDLREVRLVGLSARRVPPTDVLPGIPG